MLQSDCRASKSLEHMPGLLLDKADTFKQDFEAATRLNAEFSLLVKLMSLKDHRPQA